MDKISHWYKWSLTKSKSGYKQIRRYRKVNGKVVWEVYSSEKYQGYTDDELKTLLNRLNASRVLEQKEAEARYDFDHAYINKRSIDGFEASLTNRINAKDYIVNIMSVLYEYPLKFFVNILKVPDPNHWLRYEDQFAAFLLKGNTKSVSYLKKITQVTNRFIKYLHRTNPQEVSLIVLDPLSKMKLQNIQANVEDNREKYITPEDYKIIIKQVDKTILPAIKIAYSFGLRIAEVLGLESDDVFEDCLDIKRQLIKLYPIKFTGPLKNKAKRSVEYWFANPEDVYGWIELLPKLHHDTLSDKFKKEMTRLGLPYQFHDLRRTFITNALRKYNPRDVQLAAGHKDLRTTMLYAQDDRQLQRKKFRPKPSIKVVD